MHFCKANIAIGGDIRNIMNRSEYSPLSWPEIEVLREIHGAESINDVVPFVDVKQTAKAERERLAMMYGEAPLQARWGGKNAPDELTAPDAKLPSDVIWLNPLSGQLEKTGKGGKTSEPYTPPPPEQTTAEIVGDYAVREAETEEVNDEYSEYEQPEEVAPVEEEDNPTVEPPKKAAPKKKAAK
jgi:hypothetical protein